MSRFRIVYITLSHDGVAYEGHAWDNDQKYVFFKSIEEDAKFYQVFSLNDQDMINALADRKLFEDLVGTYYSPGLPETYNGVKRELYFKNNSFVPSYIPKEDDSMGFFPSDCFFYPTITSEK